MMIDIRKDPRFQKTSRKKGSLLKRADGLCLFITVTITVLLGRQLLRPLLRIALAAMLSVLLAISPRVVGFYEDLKGVPIEVCTFSDADVVP